MFNSQSEDRNNNGVSDLTISKGLYPDWRDRVEETTVSPEGRTFKSTVNRKELTAIERVNERFEQALVLPECATTAVYHFIVVYVSTRLITSTSLYFSTIEPMKPLAFFLLLIWLIPTVILVWRIVENIGFLKVCWWCVLAIITGLFL